MDKAATTSFTLKEEDIISFSELREVFPERKPSGAAVNNDGGAKAGYTFKMGSEGLG